MTTYLRAIAVLGLAALAACEETVTTTVDGVEYRFPVVVAEAIPPGISPATVRQTEAGCWAYSYEGDDFLVVDATGAQICSEV